LEGNHLLPRKAFEKTGLAKRKNLHYFDNHFPQQ